MNTISIVTEESNAALGVSLFRSRLPLPFAIYMYNMYIYMYNIKYNLYAQPQNMYLYTCSGAVHVFPGKNNINKKSVDTSL